MSENNTQIIENQEPVISLSDLIKRKEYFNVIQNFQAGESPAENSLIIISNIDGDILSLIEKLISLGACNFNRLSFYEFEKQYFISEEELISLISLKKIANENVENNFTQMINNFFMLPDLNAVSNINITEKINKDIQRLNSKKYVKNPITFIKDNDKLIFTQKFEDNEYKIVISKKSNSSNMDFFYNDTHILQDEMPKDLSNPLTNMQYPLLYANKISDKLTKSKNSFYVLPNLQINPNFNQKIIFSGNIIGEFKSVPCLLLMEHLVTANPNIKFLIGDQEIILKDTPTNTSLILRKLVKNDKLSTGIITQDNSFFYNIFLPSHLPQLFEILQALRNENSDLPIEYKGNWQVQFDKLSSDLKAKINLEIPFIKKNDKAKSIKDIMAKSRAKTYINLKRYELYCELKNKGFTDKDLIELKNAIGNIFFDLSYLDERLIKKYLSRNENYDNWIFGKINSILDEHFFNINQNIIANNDFEILKTKYYRVTQTKINIGNQTKNITLSTGEIINNESYSYQKFYKPELCSLFKILVKIYDEFIFRHNDHDRNRNCNTLFMIRNNPKYFEKLSDEQQTKVTLFCELIEEKQKLSPGVNILSDNQFNQTLEENFDKNYIPLLDAYRNYPYKNYKEIFENQIAKFENLHDKLKAFLMNWKYYIETEHLDISNNYIVLYEKLISENFSETELFEINWAVNNFLCDLINVENDVEELFDIKFAAEIAQDFANELMALKNEQNEINDANSQSELAGVNVDNFSVIQHTNTLPKYNVTFHNKEIDIIPNFQLNFNMQNSLNELSEFKRILNEIFGSNGFIEQSNLGSLSQLFSTYENNFSEIDLSILSLRFKEPILDNNYLNQILNKVDRANNFMMLIILNFFKPKIFDFDNLNAILEKFHEELNPYVINEILKKCKEDILTFENLIQILDLIKINLSENVIYSLFTICKNETITFENLTEILNACQHFLTFDIANEIFSQYKIQNITFENLLEIFVKCRSVLNAQLTNKIFDNYKNAISNIEDLKTFLNNYHDYLNENIVNQILSLCTNNIFNNNSIINFCKDANFTLTFQNLDIILDKLNHYNQNYILNENSINAIFSICENNIFNNETFSLFLSKIQINKINIDKNNYHIFADKVLNSDNIIKLLNAGFLIDFYLENNEFYLNNTDHFKFEGTKYSEVINSFFKKFDGTIFIQENAEQINTAIENNEARTNFNNLCDLYHKLHKDKSNEEKNKENENDNENNNPNDNEISDLNIKNENDSTNSNDNENTLDNYSTFTESNIKAEITFNENQEPNNDTENVFDTNENDNQNNNDFNGISHSDISITLLSSDDEDENINNEIKENIEHNNNEKQDLNNDDKNLSDDNKSDTIENDNLEVIENTSSTNENDDKNSNKNEPTNKNSTPKNFKLGIGLSITFATLAIISGALIFLSGFFIYFVIPATIFTIAAIATSSKTTDMYRDEKAENKYFKLKSEKLSEEEIKKQIPKDLLWRKKWRDRFSVQPESEEQNATNDITY